jgi:hypothetical protein
MMQQEIEGWQRMETKQRCGDYGVQICYEKTDEGFMETKGIELPFH